MAKKKQQADAVKNDLFPMKASELGKAAEEYVDTLVDIADSKKHLIEVEDKVIIEMEKAGRPNLLIVHGGDHYLFEIKKGEKKLRCAKKNKQPARTTEE